VPKKVLNIAKLPEASGVDTFSGQGKGHIVVSLVLQMTLVFYAVVVSMHLITPDISIRSLCLPGTVDVVTAATRKRGDYPCVVPSTPITEIRKGSNVQNRSCQLDGWETSDQQFPEHWITFAM
jgi:hypothetical protein